VKVSLALVGSGMSMKVGDLVYENHPAPWSGYGVIIDIKQFNNEVLVHWFDDWPDEPREWNKKEHLNILSEV